MKLDLKIAVIAVLILYIIFLKECGNKCKPCPEPKPAGTTVEHRTYYDTIHFHDTVKRYINIPVYSSIDSSTNTDGSTRRKYLSEVEDSLIAGKMVTEVDGTLVSAKLFYTPKFPKYIIRTDSIKTTETFRDTINQAKFQFLLGGRMGGNKNMFTAAPGLGVKTKRNNVYLVDYDLIHKTYNLSLYFPLNK